MGAGLSCGQLRPPGQAPNPRDPFPAQQICSLGPRRGGEVLAVHCAWTRQAGPSHQPPREKVTVVAQWTQTPQRERLLVLLTRYQFLFKNMLKTWRSISQDQDEGSTQIWHRKQKSALKPARVPPARPRCPSGQGVGTSPRPGPRGARSAWRGEDTPWTWPHGGGGGMGEQEHRRPALKGRGAGWTSGTRLPLRPGWVPAVSTSTSGGQGPERWGHSFHPPGPLFGHQSKEGRPSGPSQTRTPA